MKILYFGKICDQDLFNKRESKQQPYFVAQYMYEQALYEQLKDDNSIEIDVVSIYQTEYFPCDKLLFLKNNSKNGFKYLPFLNIPFFREISYFLASCYFIFKWFVRNNEGNFNYIYSSCHFPPVSAAIVLFSKILSIKSVVTFTDLPVFTYSENRIKKMKLYKKVIIRPYLKLVQYLQKSYDNYILFSEEMNTEVNKNNKPYLVIEGIYNGYNLDLKKRRKKSAIAHAGTLNKEVGVSKILEVFELIEDKSTELWLIGKGDLVEEIIEKSKKNTRIKYLGFLPRKEVFEKLKEARLLVNFRNPEDIYTKYSFPSKMFEYMVSGTPLLTTKLKGIPEEYYNYLYVIEDYSVECVKQIIEKILAKSQRELDEFGEKARKFVLENKNSVVQAKKIIDMIGTNF